jgi:hypothetical protein
VLRTVIAGLTAAVLSASAYAGDGGALDPETYRIGDRDAYEDDYSDEVDRATDEQYKAKKGESTNKERLEEKAWMWFAYIEDGDPMWSAPIYHENGAPFHSMNMANPMEAARTLNKWDVFFSLSGQIWRQDLQKDSHNGDLEEVNFESRQNWGVTRLQFGLPGGLELGVKYIFGENSESGREDTYWYEGRSQVIRRYSRDLGSKAIEGHVKWGWHHSDGISGFALTIKYKEPLAERSDLLDTTAREAGANISGSIKWGITSFHANIGGIYTKSTRILFHAVPSNPTDVDPDRVRLKPFFTGGLAGTIQVFDFLMVILQVEAHTNAWRRELEDVMNEKIIASGTLGLRARVGPLVIEGGFNSKFNTPAARYGGIMTVGIKF